MEHIRQFDWCYNERESQHFVTEEAMDNSCTERILSNGFYDPLISSDEEGSAPHCINWDEVFSRVNSTEPVIPRTYVPGLRPVPTYPRLSSLSRSQQSQLLKVVNSHYPNVLEAVHIPRPTKFDRRLYDDLKEKYEKEQKEFIAWAKTQWITGHNIRALKPKPVVETVYEAELKMKMHEHQSLPKSYEMAAQISFKSDVGSFEFVPQKDLITVNVSDLPAHTPLPKLFEKKTCIARPTTCPEPCPKHPCRFILPGESSVSELPHIEIQRELAQFAAESGARACVSETALQKLVDGTAWELSLAVCSVGGPAGPTRLPVLGALPTRPADPRLRSQRALSLLLHAAVVPPEEKARMISSWRRAARPAPAPAPEHRSEHHSDDEDDQLVIDMDSMATSEQTDEQEPSQPCEVTTDEMETDSLEKKETEDNVIIAKDKDGEKQLPQLFCCTCSDTLYEKPPPRSFRKWEARSKENNETFNIIVHCSHKLKGTSGEVILEAIPEYQIDLGASEIPKEKLNSLALAMHLRKNASVLIMRVDGPTGDLVTWQSIKQEDLEKQHPEFIPDASNTIYTLLNNLKDLLPGNYILKHEVEHGTNALLYRAAAAGSLQRGAGAGAGAGPGGAGARPRLAPPTLTPLLLPAHKYRQILPCAFTTNPMEVTKEHKKPAARQKHPPQAIKLDGGSERGAKRSKWPKKKKKGKKRQAQ